MSPRSDLPARSGSRPLVVASAVLLILATLTGLYTVWDGLLNFRAAQDDQELVALLDLDESVLEELAAEIYGRNAQIATTSELEDATSADLTLLAERASALASVPRTEDQDQDQRLRQLLAEPMVALSQARAADATNTSADPNVPGLTLLQSDVLALARIYGTLFSDPVLTAHAARLSASEPPAAAAIDPKADPGRHDLITALAAAAVTLRTQAMARLVASGVATLVAGVVATLLIVVTLRRRPARRAAASPGPPETAAQGPPSDPNSPAANPGREPWASRVRPADAPVPPPPRPPELVNPVPQAGPGRTGFDTGFAPQVASPDPVVPVQAAQPATGLTPFASPDRPASGPTSQALVEPVVAPVGTFSVQQFYPPSRSVTVVESPPMRPAQLPNGPTTGLAATPAASAYAAVKVSAALRQAALKTSQPRRVWVTLAVDPVIAGSYVGAVCEIMAELLTNAINFSPSTARVDLTTAVVPGGIRIDIVDSGPALTDSQIAAYNQALASPAGLTTLPPSGLARVGRLVHQLNGRVALASQGPSGGLRAAVALPEALFHWPAHNKLPG